MSHTVETAPTVRERLAEARRAARQAKASREKRIIECLNRGVSIVEIAEREDVSEKRMRALVRDILARRMPEPPAQFLAMQVNRLNEALRLSFGAMSGANLQAVDRVVRIVRELDRYHGFTAAQRWGLPLRPKRSIRKPTSRLLRSSSSGFAKRRRGVKQSVPRPEMARRWKPCAPEIRRPTATAPSGLVSNRPARRRSARELRRKGLKRLNPGS